MIKQPESRWTAFAIHLALSAAIFVVLAAIIIFFWYPGFLFQTDGGWQGIRLIAGIDLVLGPLLTLIVYNKGKKSLKADLSVIAAIQFSALFAGTYLVYQERPIAVIFADDKFSTVSQNSFRFHGLDPYENPLMNGAKPVWLYVPRPLTQAEHEMSLLQQSHLDQRRYQPLDQHRQQLKMLGKTNIPDQDSVDDSSPQRYYPVLSRYYEGYLLVDTETLAVDKLILGRSTDDMGINVQ